MGLSPTSADACAAFRTLHPKLYELALVIQQHEGFIPKRGPKAGSLSWRNNNPGNLRKSELATDEAGGFCVFPDYYTGLLALLLDLSYKCIGRTVNNLGPDSTLGDLIKVYAPPSENDTEQYIRVACAGTGLPSTAKLRSLYWS